MQIHELDEFGGQLNADAYVAVDNGEDTGKVPVPRLLKTTEENIEQLERELNARIDNIIAGGAAPSEAEIIDSRIGAASLGSIQYPSLGASIRGQTSQLKQIIDALTDEGEKQYTLDWESGMYNAAGKTASAANYRTASLIYLKDGEYKIHSDVQTYVYCYQDTDYTGGRGASFPWGGTGDNILVVSGGRNYIGIFSAKLNEGIPTTTTLRGPAALFEDIESKIDKDYSAGDIGKAIVVDYNGTASISDVLETGEIERKFTWEDGGLNANGKYNSFTNKRTANLIYLEDGNYIVHPNGTGAYAISCFADAQYNDGIATNVWNVTGDQILTVSGRNYIGIMCNTDNPVEDLSIPILTLIKQNEIRIDDLETTIMPGVPYYYVANSYFSSRLENLQAALESVGNGDAFVFFTDLHIADNSCTSFPIIRAILENTPIDKVFCGGDIPTAYNEGTTAMPPAYNATRSLQLQARKFGKLVNTYLKPFASIFGARGNHDFHIQQNPSSEQITEPFSWTYNYLVRNAEKSAVLEADNAHYYYDNKPQKIRYIVLNTYDLPNDAPGLSQSQYDWLIEALNVPVEWEIVVIGHTPIYNEMTSYEAVLAPVWGILTAYQNRREYTYAGDVNVNVDFTAANGVIVGYFCGHNHLSEQFFVDNLLTMSFICDARYSTPQVTRGYKTISESSVAILVFDKDSGTLKEFNFGAGFNRTETYK